MCCQIPESVRHACRTFRGDCVHELAKIPLYLANINDGIGRVFSTIAYLTDSIATFIAAGFYGAVVKTIRFIKDNFKPLVAYLFAWAVIITCTGLMYGFNAVALPLTIGLGCGVGFGMITGILTVTAFDSQMTLWNLLNEIIEKLDPNGTRQIVLAVAVTVLLAASVVFPYVMGGVMGVFMGNQLAAKTALNRNLGRDPDKDKFGKESLKQEIENIHQKIDVLSVEVEKIQNIEEKQAKKQEIIDLMQQLRRINRNLEQMYPIEVIVI